MNAFAEHTEALGIKTVNISHTSERTNSKGKTFIKKNLREMKLIKTYSKNSKKPSKDMRKKVNIQ